MANLSDIEGIGEVWQGKMKAAGVNTVADLLEQGATPAGRKALEEKTGVRHELLLEWVNHADLYRIPGVGSEYSDLLQAVGVNTVVEMSKRNPANLHMALVELNLAKKLVRRMPSEGQVAQWVAAAKALPRVVSY